MRRALLIILVIFLVLLGAASLVSRAKIKRALNLSLVLVNSSPREAYDSLRAPLSRNNLLTFGEAARARDVFTEALVKNAVLNLSARGLGQRNDSFEVARQTMTMLNRIESDSGLNLTDSKMKVIHAAYEATDEILRKGSLTLWNEMLDFFRFLEANKLIPEMGMTEFRRWSEQVRSVPVRDLAVRQETRYAINTMTRALANLGLTAHRPGEGPLAMSVPLENGASQFESSDKDLMRGADSISELVARYDDGSGDLSLVYEIQGKLLYNHAALMLTHALDQGAVSRRFGSGFVASLMIETDKSRVPPAGDMYLDFLRVTSFVFTGSKYAKGSADYFDRIKNPPDSIRAYKAMIMWNCAMCMEKMNQNPAPYRESADRIAETITDPRAREILQSMKNNPRPLLIVELPEPPSPES